MASENAIVEKQPQMPLGTGLYLHTVAARLTQTTSQVLSYWSHSDLIAPHVHRRDGGPSVYSYDDLLAIRAVVRLRAERLPLQRIRKAITYFYANIGAVNWWNLKMVVYRRKDLVVIIPKDESPTGEEEIVMATRGGQKPIEILFGDLVSDLLRGDKLLGSPEIPRHVDINRNVQGGAPVVKGSRIRTSILYYWHKCGLSIGDISEMYGGLDKDTVSVAIRYEQLLDGRN